MSVNSLSDFARALFREGQIEFESRPETPRVASQDVLEDLRREFWVHGLRRAGRLLEFSASTAARALEFTRWSCWFLVNRDDSPDLIQKKLRWDNWYPSGQELTHSDHASADLAFRFLPFVHRRAKATRPDDPLTLCLEDVLRAFPFSGVLSDIATTPSGPLNFDREPGLRMEYAERWMANPKPAWIPASGLIRECAEWVVQENRQLSQQQRVQIELAFRLSSQTRAEEDDHVQGGRLIP